MEYTKLQILANDKVVHNVKVGDKCFYKIDHDPVKSGQVTDIVSNDLSVNVTVKWDDDGKKTTFWNDSFFDQDFRQSVQISR